MAFPQRYRPQYGAAPPISPGVLTPFEDDVPQAFDPQAQAEDFQTPSSLAPPPDAIPKPPRDDDTEAAASLSKLPPLNPDADSRASGMRRMGGGMPAPAPAPAASPTPEASPAAPPATPSVSAAPPIAPVAAPQAKPSGGSDLEQRERDALGGVAKTTQALKDSAKPNSNWAQRLGMAVLSMTRFAPVANQIMHPKWSEERRGLNRELEAEQAQLGAVNTAMGTESLAAQREASVEQKKGLADEATRKNLPHAGMQQLDEQFAKKNLPWLKPNAAGEYWVDKAVANTLSKPDKAAAMHVVPAGSTVVDENGKVLFSAPEKPEKVTGEFERFFLPNFAKKLGKTPEQMTPDENTQAFREFKQDPEAKAAQEASRGLTDSLKQLQINQQPTPQQAQQVAQDMVAHRIAPEQMASMFGGFGQAGQNFKRMVYGEAKKLDPEFDFERAAAEYGLVKSPQFQNTIRYMDSVQNSIPLVIQRAKELGNGKIRFVNGLANMGRDQLNNPALAKFQADALLVADEVAKILQGGGTGNGTSDAKLKQAAEIIRQTDSPETLAAKLADVQQLMSFRRKSLTRGTYMENNAEGGGGGGAVLEYVRDASGKLVPKK